MDNDSDDGTREILEKLRKDFEIIIIDEKGIFQQAKWMKQLAHISKKELQADWVINSDTDEFWIPKNSSNLKEVLAFKGSVLTVQRYNMILDEECIESGSFFNAKYYVANPIFYTKERQLAEEKISIPLVKIGPKTIVNPHGLIYIRGGNHKASHIANMRDYLKSGYDKIKRFDAIEVFHYPFRSYEQFEKRVEIAHLKMTQSRKLAKFGPHMRRWSKLYEAGKLQEEFDSNIVFNKNEIDVLSKYGIVRYDEKIKQRIV